MDSATGFKITNQTNKQWRTVEETHIFNHFLYSAYFIILSAWITVVVAMIYVCTKISARRAVEVRQRRIAHLIEENRIRFGLYEQESELRAMRAHRRMLLHEQKVLKLSRQFWESLQRRAKRREELERLTRLAQLEQLGLVEELEPIADV